MRRFFTPPITFRDSDAEAFGKFQSLYPQQDTAVLQKLFSNLVMTNLFTLQKDHHGQHFHFLRFGTFILSNGY